MSINRRNFIKLSAATGGVMSLGQFSPGTTGRAAHEARHSVEQNAGAATSKPLRILILGGTGFTGPHQVRYALSRGHKVTVFNRGRTHPGETPKEVEQLIGDRNGKLDALKGRKWDVVIDNPTTLPVWVRDAARILKGNAERYVFISTISVYSDTSKPGMDESGPLAKYEGTDPMKETMETLRASNYGLYGPLKVLSEQEAEKWFPGKTLVIRPGLIVGPGDPTGRFSYWPLRIDRGGEVLAPGDPTDPVQFIDGRDLAEWTIRMVEQGETGTYNATGPASVLTVAEMLYGIKAVTTSDAHFTWVDTDFLEAQKVSPWGDMPVWVPARGESAGFGLISIKRALSKGLTFRPLAVTARDTLDWYKTLSAEEQAKMKAGITPQRETEVLAAWHARKKQSA
ncbi:MAG TPA: NAD-dependent epimerase/dehydratase family protein [Pyrinomonadaceae bacterium]|nr:NAD-dependent epimerase/dehydratase family protein [Pyrinomonadaceae bacterium]